MPICPKCGKPVEADQVRCPHDGEVIVDTTTIERTPAIVRDPAPELELPRLLSGDRYQLLSRLGGGGMSVVYRGVDRHLGRPVAVKVISPHLRANPAFDGRFQREAQILSRLSDPHIVTVHDFGIDGSAGPYLIMQLLDGETVRDFMAREGKFPVPLALALALQLFQALYHAHDRGIVHRDLKPDNLFLVDQDGLRRTLRVVDFGIAKILHDDRGRHHTDYTNPGTLLGTPRYMAPEVFDGREADARTDLYSAGLVLFEMLAGEMPKLFGRRLRELREEVPEELESLIEQCLKPDPDERPVSAAEAFATLLILVKDRGSVSLSPTAIQQLSARFRSVSVEGKDPPPLEQPPPPGRGPVRTVAAVIAALVVGAIVLLAAAAPWFR